MVVDITQQKTTVPAVDGVGKGHVALTGVLATVSSLHHLDDEVNKTGSRSHAITESVADHHQRWIDTLTDVVELDALHFHLLRHEGRVEPLVKRVFLADKATMPVAFLDVGVRR